MKSVLFLSVALACTTALADPIYHAGSTDPTTEGWYVMSGVAGEPVPAPDDAGYWSIATSGHGRYGPVTLPGADDFASNWHYMVEYQHVAGPAGEKRATLFDGLRGKGYSFTWDTDNAYYYLAGQGDTAIPGIDPLDWHTYRLDYTAATELATVSVDGTQVASMEWYEQNDTNPGQYLFYWGDNSGAPHASEGNWRFVGFNADPSMVPPGGWGGPEVPEPTTLMLLAAAGLGLVWYPRRRRR